MPEGNKSRVSGDGVESNRPATNFPGISVDSNRVNRLVEKSGLGVEPRRLESPINHSIINNPSPTGCEQSKSLNQGLRGGQRCVRLEKNSHCRS